MSTLARCLVLLLALSAAGTLPLPAANHSPASPDSGLSVILGRPTDRSITLSVLSNEDLSASLEYTSDREPGTKSSETKLCKAGVPTEFELAGLSADTPYRYSLKGQYPGKNAAEIRSSGQFQTQRNPGSSFTFSLQGDSHPEREGKMYDPKLYATTLRNVAAEAPDFHIAMGDDFSIEHLIAQKQLSQPAVDRVYALQRGFLGIPGSSSAIFLVNGNHEQAALCNLDGSEENCAVLAGRVRTRYYPLPAPDFFYGGDAEPVKQLGLPRDYYSWTWGDALFVVIDFYWHSPSPVDNQPGARAAKGKGQGGDKGGKNRDPWAVTLGETQYRWLEQTLTQSKARWKFVFCHHVLGTGRGGVEGAGLYEWGGRDRRGENSFSAKRPGWAMPLHDLFVKTGVSIFFQGHDHLYAHQSKDGVIYQTCPNPADPSAVLFNKEAYRSGDLLPNSGHLRVSVSPEAVKVEYIRSFLPADEGSGHHNGEVAASYLIEAQQKPATP